MAGFVFISEINYDNSGSGDTGEFIELTGTTGFDLTGWSIVLYNGNNGSSYDTKSLSGTITEERDGFGSHVIDFPDSHSIQNGAPDGVALVNQDGTVVEFISYEGEMTAVGGPADGMTSDDIGVFQTNSTAVGSSLEYNAMTDSWQVNDATNTKGSVGVSIPCFLAGTAIETSKGLKPVESLVVGEQLLTTEGRFETIKWIGYRQVSVQFAGAHSNPICIMEGAFGLNKPFKDLYVSPDHAMYFDGILIQAQALVNGTTITQVEMNEDYTYYHIELNRHALIYAEGAETETFVDAGVRARFDNSNEFEALYPHAEPVQPMAMPRIKAKRQIPSSIQMKLNTNETA